MRLGLHFALIVIVAAASFYLGTQVRETPGPAESLGKSLDESANELGRKLRDLADDVEQTMRGDPADH